MNVKLRVLSAGVLFFIGQGIVAQTAKKDTTSTKEIEEVVVVAYGKQKKEAITGSVTELKAKELKEISSANIVQGMAGKVSGVQIFTGNGLPGEAPTVRFRGIGSINGSSAPLYVVDGVPFSGDIAAINNSDIESMTFLKDAASASLYGNRAANGVIIITTKKGKSGKPQFNLDLKAGVASRGIPEYAISSSIPEYYEYYYNLLKNTAISAGSSVADAHQSAIDDLITGSQGLGYNVTNVANNQLIDANGRFNSSAKVLYQEDWKDFLFKDGFYTNTYFSARSGTDNTTVFYSLGYEANDTYMVNSKWEKITGRITADSKLGSKLKFGGNLAYSFTKQNAPDGFNGGTAYSNPFQWSRFIAPIYPVHAYDAQGNIIKTSTGENAYDDGTGRYTGNVRRYGALQNPYATAINDIKVRKTNQIFAGGYATLNILKGLDFTYKVTGEFQNRRANELDTPLYGDAVDPNGRLYNWNRNISSLNQQQLLEYSTSLGKLNLNVLAAHESYKRDSDYMETHVTNGLLVDGIYSDMFATLVSAAGNGSPYSLDSYFGRINLDYDNKYFLTASARRDGSSRFHPDNRWGNFYSIGGSWVVSNEDFFKNNVVNYLKLKASYGEVGNDNLGYDFPYLDLYSVVQTTVSSPLISYNQVFKGNKDISWEKNKNFNVGLDLGLFNNRIKLDAEYFKKKTNDLLYMKPLPLSEGFASMPENIGDMENRGFEVNLSADVVRTQDFNINIFGNATFLKNEILALPDTSEGHIISGSHILKPGNSMYTWYMREFAGVNPNTGQALWTVVDANGNRSTTEDYNSASRIDTGLTAVPDVYGGFGLSVKYKNIDLTSNFAYQFGGTGYDSMWMSLMGGGLGENFHKDYYNTWSSTNTSALLPVVTADDTKQNYLTSTLGLIKNDYISLQNISLGYTFDKSLINSLGITNLRLFVTADNVYVWSKRKGYDPRMSIQGISSSNYSPIRTISFGANISF
ncbi:SusC/RagA family TonB-linked outer membrane protein [Elizabethkingia sp. JS20170427COW]|uniref:SusC/RagA family TonB-linked outer membrane protein n=1 Tax=Elizabethkingia sp. JS20170427COW TaxID=2583851 RepID=UPI00111049A9|nr:SusC/RagA family TonB-linked outer membrane protein [Elizabethkingia sp. JS20170427COW]QCX53447.1 SusC/RagA family TonB-linked outer membrane protein [Elizabethkingia sp. JS20170427COW]